TLNPQPSLDRLFRNLGNGRFEDVTLAATIIEDRFSQGATVGDFDSDGFPDLYVANIGGNRLFRNNGDGTFSDVTERTATAGDRWTTSCLMADLNGDALPEIYAVNYLSGEDVFTRVCNDRGGSGICMPQHFPAAQDQLYLNLGDGRFEDITERAGIAVPDGKGLGIVAADFLGRGRLDLFIANDAVPNFFFENQTSGPRPSTLDSRPSSGPQLSTLNPRPSTPLFSEQALLKGVALNRGGQAEACMGVAAGDADGDGRIDLFVTNFHLESNTLYLQREGGWFDDATRDAGLRQPSLSLLGFGTQFLDADLDGRLDLIVTNGHIDDFTSDGTAYRMPPQFFRGLGGGRFQELPADSLGPYFAERYLGRGLARLDWNRDGREDVVVSHLDAPAALLTNETQPAGHFLVIRLVGVESNRDAIGATVTVRTADAVETGQLTAGDGYLASNQRQLVFGLRTAQRVEEMLVRWPSGREERFVDLAVDAELIAVEGAPAPRILRRLQSE
ncbi:MAG: CRTAC1 family protein, partial [Planctomycetes bacterium]|nr:CRTAC1 family protein [Planctomycetota bacterium]